eukprot:SAG22_NODE_1149_length_5353_cov_1.820898_1_plen_333_part_00
MSRHGMTPAQRQSWEEDGFFVLPSFLSGGEVARLLSAAEELAAQFRHETAPLDSETEGGGHYSRNGYSHVTAHSGAIAETLRTNPPFQVRNVLARHPAFLDLVDHPGILPKVVDAIGPDIQIRTSHLDYRPPYPAGVEPGEVGFGESDEYTPQRNWHPDLAPQLSATVVGTAAEDTIPFFELKVFYALFDMSQSGCGNLWLAKGSHKRKRAELVRCQETRAQPPGATELRVPVGSAVVWRTAVWHCVGPNTSESTRKIVHVGYHHRWLRPTDYTDQDPELLARCDPVRRQLLGAMPEGRSALGTDPEWAPASKFWQPSDDDVPLRSWRGAKM